MIQYFKDVWAEFRKVQFPSKSEFKKDMIVVTTTLIGSAVLFYLIGIGVLAIFSKVI